MWELFVILKPCYVLYGTKMQNALLNKILKLLSTTTPIYIFFNFFAITETGISK